MRARRAHGGVFVVHGWVRGDVPVGATPTRSSVEAGIFALRALWFEALDVRMRGTCFGSSHESVRRASQREILSWFVARFHVVLGRGGARERVGGARHPLCGIRAHGAIRVQTAELGSRSQSCE